MYQIKSDHINAFIGLLIAAVCQFSKQLWVWIDSKRSCASFDLMIRIPEVNDVQKINLLPFGICLISSWHLKRSGENITIDEQLVPFRSRCAFKQYLTKKPDQYGLKVLWACDSQKWFPLNGIPYLGRERSGSSKNVGIATQKVMDLCRPFITTRHLNFFSQAISWQSNCVQTS